MLTVSSSRLTVNNLITDSLATFQSRLKSHLFASVYHV